jgi:hypothetical protein
MATVNKPMMGGVGLFVAALFTPSRMAVFSVTGLRSDGGDPQFCPRFGYSASDQSRANERQVPGSGSVRLNG